MSAATHIPPKTQAEPSGSSATMRARTLLGAAIVIGALSIVALILDLGWIVGAVLALAALAVIVVGPFIAMRRRSFVVAPLAIALVSLLNPLILGGITAHVTNLIGVVTLQRGLVLWADYPGIVGWDAPDELTVVDPGALARQTQDVTRDVVDTLSSEYGWSWSIGESVGGTQSIANGFGGPSVFVRIDSATWTTADFDGSEEQAQGLLAAMQSAADELGLTTVGDAIGEESGGEATWSDGRGGVLTLSYDGSEVSFWYIGGPFSTVSTEEYDALLEPYAGLGLPEPIVEPDLP